MNCRKLPVVFTFFVALLIFADTASAQQYSRIRFAKGSVAKTVYGTLHNYNGKRIFKLRVRAGQTISYEQRRGKEDRIVTILVYDPAGENVNDMDASCNNRGEITPTVSGDYRFEVFECQKADEWSGSFSFRVTVR